jgi:release factor glutamine methyltransferase
LVEAVLERVRGAKYEGGGAEGALHAPRTPPPALKILDIGTGCGAVGLALATEIRSARIYALDCSRAALKIASRNAAALGLLDRVHFLEGDLIQSLCPAPDRGGFDVIVSNPPYVPSDALASLPPEIIAYEPLGALDGGPDGLRYHRRIIEEAPGCLRAGGWLGLEVGEGQSPAVVELFRKGEAFGPPEVRRDLGGRDRVVLASRKDKADG